MESNLHEAVQHPLDEDIEMDRQQAERIFGKRSADKENGEKLLLS